MDSDFPGARGPAVSNTLTTLVTATRALSLPADRLVGRRLEGRYEILRPLDRGGMATVYVAVDHRLEREVAVKVMHPSLAHDPAFVARFRREATAAASIRHPHVVAVTDAGTDDDTVFLVMELVRGRTLRALLRDRGRLSPAQTLEIGDAVLDALAAAHATGLVHRDVKPENVLLGDDGTIAVADFGLARAVEASSLTTHAGLLLGTVAYVSPEQVSHGRADARSDVYAAGILLFELLTGAVPYDAETPVAVAYRHVHERVPAPSSVAGGIPSELDDLVLAATAPDPAERYPDAGAFLTALRRVRAVVGARPARGGDTTALVLPATPVTPTDRPGPVAATPARRRHVWPWVLAVLVLLSAGAGVGGWWLGRDAGTHVPALTDRSLSAVEAALTASHLAYSVGPAQHSDAVSTGQVVTTVPAPGAAVKAHGTVLIVPSAGVLRLTVPAIAGRPQPTATTLLAQVGFGPPTVTTAYSDVTPAGTVLTSTPATGATVDHRTRVALVVSAGPAPVTVPDESGQSQVDAQHTLTSLGLKTAVSQQFSATVPSGTVISATPDAGTAHRGDTVSLVVSKGPQTVIVPNLDPLNGGQADAALRALGLVPREIALFGIHGGQVVTQKQKPGSTVPVGSTVTFYTAY